MNGRVLPNNLEAEQSVLGACFLSKYALQKAGENLSPESFYNDKNGKIFATMISLMEEHTPIDLTTVTSALKKKNELTVPAVSLVVSNWERISTIEAL